ncbi:hypothetical protein, partial [Paramuribaculum intestinale]|uniref:hypothetical protein n=1 Tax=Paramuribaculum intestinale TaxID=2094151 RepID=UPI0025B4B9F4
MKKTTTIPPHTLCSTTYSIKSPQFFLPPTAPITSDPVRLSDCTGQYDPMIKNKAASMVPVTMEAACQKGGGYLLSRFRSIIGVV